MQCVTAENIETMAWTQGILAIAIFLALSLNTAHGATAIVASEGGTCSRTDSKGINTFIIQAEAPGLGLINNMLIKFDTVRQLPVSSTAFHDRLNIEKVVDRVAEPFGPLPCPQLPVNALQQNCSGGFSMTPAQQLTSGRYTWDRGHLTPVNPMRFSEDAVNKTFYCVNVSPQDSFTNQNPWKDVEVRSEVKLRSTNGAFVQTGLCSADNLLDGPSTYRGWRIPSCYWKLICYKDVGTGTVHVVGFIGENTLVGKADTAAQAARSASTLTPRSQAEVLERMAVPDLVGQAWTTAGTSLTGGRGVTRSKIPTAAQCKGALELDSGTAKEWAAFISA